MAEAMAEWSSSEAVVAAVEAAKELLLSLEEVAEEPDGSHPD